MSTNKLVSLLLLLLTTKYRCVVNHINIALVEEITRRQSEVGR